MPSSARPPTRRREARGPRRRRRAAATTPGRPRATRACRRRPSAGSSWAAPTGDREGWGAPAQGIRDAPRHCKLQWFSCDAVQLYLCRRRQDRDTAVLHHSTGSHVMQYSCISVCPDPEALSTAVPRGARRAERVAGAPGGPPGPGGRILGAGARGARRAPGRRVVTRAAAAARTLYTQ